ncbi:hypothetical protein, partial [Hydrogenophaga palleronii]|uniref:hypothetical protein n=1 Tax=Hydrogenophaga palleronii TaxID=65655 RepID=UPI00286AC6C4
GAASCCSASAVKPDHSASGSYLQDSTLATICTKCISTILTHQTYRNRGWRQNNKVTAFTQQNNAVLMPAPI